MKYFNVCLQLWCFKMKGALLVFGLLYLTCVVNGRPQMMGMVDMEQQQKEMSRMNQMGAGIGLSLGLGLNSGMVSRSNQRINDGLSRMQRSKRAINLVKRCIIIIMVPDAKTTTTPTNTTANIDPRKDQPKQS